jgi:hypothetical protein
VRHCGSADFAVDHRELMGGRFGEMSRLMNYKFQSFSFRSRQELRPFYDLIANTEKACCRSTPAPRRGPVTMCSPPATWYSPRNCRHLIGEKSKDPERPGPIPTIHEDRFPTEPPAVKSLQPLYLVSDPRILRSIAAV